MPYIKLEDLQKFPLRRDHYDKGHGSEEFINGVETVLEYAEYLPIADVVPRSEVGGEFICFVGGPHRTDHCSYLDEIEKARHEIELLKMEIECYKAQLTDVKKNTKQGEEK